MTTKIEWTDETWNPVVGCSVVSPGCTNCYAMKMAARLEKMGQPIYQGHTKTSKSGAVWTGKVELSNWGRVIKPLSWRKPRRIFVNSMSDLFHENLPDEAIDKVFAVMALCPQHTFQVLTKRPERMRGYFEKPRPLTVAADPEPFTSRHHIVRAADKLIAEGGARDTIKTLGDWADFAEAVCRGAHWPLPNVWLGTSVEDQPRADERIPHLLATPAAVRFLSCEPLLGPVSLERIPDAHGWGNALEPQEVHGGTGQCVDVIPAIDWVIVGGESGPGARPMELAWAYSIVKQCRDAGVACFVKQMGSNAISTGAAGADPDGVYRYHWRDRKGGDWSEWLDELRVREFPQVRT